MGRSLKPSIVALIPARAGSKRIPGKNTRLLAGHPLIAYTIAAAKESGIFGTISVCSDDRDVLSLAKSYEVGSVLRPSASDEQPDIEWVQWAAAVGCFDRFDAFAILRPTSPFRTAATIREAWDTFQFFPGFDSMRMVRPVTEHPGKMWRLRSETYNGAPRVAMVAAILGADRIDNGAPWHSSPTQTLPHYYVQTGGLEIAWTTTVTVSGSISGTYIAPYITEGHEGFDLNTERDWREAERLIATGEATLPPLPLARVSPAPTPQ